MLEGVPQVVSMDQPRPFSPPLPPAAVAALQLGRQIEAIKILRQEQGLGLREAKDRVDRYLLDNPVLRERLTAWGSLSPRGCLLAAMGLVLLIGLATFLYFHAQG
jgi:hypothetical protein